jgi:hypothetical protein
LIDTTAAVLAWVGTALVVVSDGRRALGAGIAIAGAGFALLAFDSAGAVPAAALAGGGAVAAARRYVSGVPGWAILPAGSTARLVLCIGGAIVAVWVAVAVATGPGAPLRFAVMLAIGLAGARSFVSPEPSAMLTTAAVLALAVGLAATLAQPAPGPWPYVTAGVVAACLGWLPMRKARAA